MIIILNDNCFLLWHPSLPGIELDGKVHASVPMSGPLEPLMHELLVQQDSPSSFYDRNMVQSVHTKK